MAILLIRDLDFPNGGANTAHASLIVKGIRENNERAVLIIPRGKYTNDKRMSYRRKGNLNNIPYLFMVDLKNNQKNLFKKIFAKRGIIDTVSFLWKREKSGRKDIVIIVTPNVIKQFPIIFMCWLKKIPLFFWIVEKMSLNLEFKGLIGILNFFSEKLTESNISRFSSGNIVISTFLKKHYLKYLPENKVMISPIFVDPLEQPNSKILDKLKSFKKRYQDKKILVYSGTFAEKDGIHYLLDAFSILLKKIPNAYFIMTGKSPRIKTMQDIRSHISNLDIEKSTLLTGFVSREELACYNMIADILLVCRTNSDFANFGFPWKLGEYCMTKKPILATRVGDIELYFTDNKDIFLAEPENVVSIKTKMEFILTNYKLSTEIAINGFYTSKKHFNYISETEKVIKFINRNSFVNEQGI